MILPDHDDRWTALRDFQRNLVVTAGAGTGKTSLLVGRLLSALLLQHLEPGQILAMTFTENAAAEMHERLVRMLGAIEGWLAGDEVDGSDSYIFEQLGIGPENLSRARDLLERVEELRISTFHGFCLRFLQEHARELDLPPEIDITDLERHSPGFDEVFLGWLKEASDGEVHEALRRFEPTELRELAMAFLELPEDSLDRMQEYQPPDTLGARAEELLELVQANPKARKNWQTAAHSMLEGYAALLAGDGFQSEWLTKATPKAGKREVGDELNERLTESLDQHRRFLRPFLLADQEAISIAIDFVRPVLQRHRRESAQRGALSFQDLLLLTRRTLLENTALRAAMGRRLHAILVDEFQDTDPLQYNVVFLLGCEPTVAKIHDPMELQLRPGVLFIVGDPKQSIYRFRRADVAAFARAVSCVEEQGGATLALTANFRSLPPILELVNAVCKRTLASDPPYQFGYEPVVPMLPTSADAAVEVLQVDAEEELNSAERRRREGEIIVSRIEALRREGTDYGEVAILLRAATETSWILRPLRAAGIPYVLEGSRRFYRRFEIIFASSLIRAMARPHDPVAVLAMLRSSQSDATDAEIVEYLERGGTLDYRLASADQGPVGACLRRLRDLHETVRAMPVDAALTLLLADPGLRLAEGVGFEGAQRLANIERLLQRLLQQRPLDLGEAATLLQQSTDLETDDEESPLFDDGVQAVRILTVHGAKGLEFGAVFLPDLARYSGYREEQGDADVQRLFDEHGTEMVTVRIGDVRNVANLVTKDDLSNHDRAEQRRLFYVAATRARQKLFLVCGEHIEPKGEKGTNRQWQDDLLAADDARYDKRLSGATDLSRPRRAATEIDPAAALQAARAHRELSTSLAEQVRDEDIVPSALATESAAPAGASETNKQLTFDFAPPDADQPRPRRRRRPAPAPAPGGREDHPDAMAVGSAMHAYLAGVDFGRGAPDDDLLGQLPGGDDLAAMARAFHRGTIRERLAAATHLHREVPIAFLDEAGRQVHGIIDLIVEEPDTVTVLDWKTDDVADRSACEERAGRYREQLQHYGRGVQKALGLTREPRLEVHFLRTDTTVRV